MGFDNEIHLAWCLGDTWRCTPAEAIGIWSVLAFYSGLVFVTAVHYLIQNQNRGGSAAQSSLSGTSNTDEIEFGTVCSLLVYFFTFAAGSFTWVAAGIKCVHPFQVWWLQLIGSAIMVVCLVLFITVHVNMSSNWSPIPEVQNAEHELVTHGLFGWARHPMYAVFLWASIGTLLATLNWLIAWVVFGSVLVVFRRIKKEERILVNLYGGQYLEYRQRVSALGPPWCCLGFDREWRYRNFEIEQ